MIYAREAAAFLRRWAHQRFHGRWDADWELERGSTGSYTPAAGVSVRTPHDVRADVIRAQIEGVVRDLLILRTALEKLAKWTAKDTRPSLGLMPDHAAEVNRVARARGKLSAILNGTGSGLERKLTGKVGVLLAAQRELSAEHRMKYSGAQLTALMNQLDSLILGVESDFAMAASAIRALAILTAPFFENEFGTALDAVINVLEGTVSTLQIGVGRGVYRSFCNFLSPVEAGVSLLKRA